MTLADSQLHTMCEHLGMVHPYNPENVGPASIDLTLHSQIAIQSYETGPLWERRDLFDDGPYMLAPGEFILASTAEVVTMPRHLCGQLMLRSSAARMGLEHSFSGLVDPTFAGQLTLELRNNLRRRPIEISQGMRIVQLVVSEMKGTCVRPYDKTGWYQGQAGPTPSNERVKAGHRPRRDMVRSAIAHNQFRKIPNSSEIPG